MSLILSNISTITGQGNCSTARADADAYPNTNPAGYYQPVATHGYRQLR